MKNATKDSLALLPNSSSGSQIPAASTEEVLKLSVQLLIAFLGCVGNVLVCIVVSKQRRKQSGTNLYIQVLSVADFLVLSVNCPLALIVQKLPNRWPLGEFVCRYLYPLPETFYGVSVWIIVAIALERYRGVVHDKRVTGQKVLKRVRLTVVCLWIASFVVFSLPLCFFTVFVEKPNGIRHCGIAWPDFAGANAAYKTYSVSLTLFSYVFPLIIFLWTYFSIMHRLRKSDAFIKTMTNKNTTALSATQERRMSQNKRANRILTPVVVLFAISMFPLTVLRTLIPFWIQLAAIPSFPSLIYVASIGATINSAANPLIYSIICKDFRRDFKNLFCKKKKKKDDSLISSTTLLSLRTTFESLRTTTL